MRETARSATSPPSSALPAPIRQLRLLVLGLRQRRPARPLRQRLPGQGSPRSCAALLGLKIERAEPPPALPQPRLGRLPRRLQRGRARPGHGADGLRISATSTTTATSTSTSGPARCPTRAWSPTSCSRTSRAAASRTSRPVSGTGHLQKGHGVSFADWDCDGDLDLFVELGGAIPGDQAYNLLFQNPGHGRHWLKVKLVGTKTNRAALGAKIRVDLKGHRRPDALDLPHGRQQLQLRRQQPGRDDRPGRRDARRRADGLLADEQDDPDLPRPRRRPGDRDHRGLRRRQVSSPREQQGPESLVDSTFHEARVGDSEKRRYRHERRGLAAGATGFVSSVEVFS